MYCPLASSCLFFSTFSNNELAQYPFTFSHLFVDLFNSAIEALIAILIFFFQDRRRIFWPSLTRLHKMPVRLHRQCKHTGKSKDFIDLYICH